MALSIRFLRSASTSNSCARAISMAVIRPDDSAPARGRCGMDSRSFALNEELNGRLPHDRRRPARAGLRGRSEILAQDRVSAVARPGILQPAAGGSIPSGSRAALARVVAQDPPGSRLSSGLIARWIA